MTTELIELIGEPAGAGFQTFFDWRAQLAKVNCHLVPEDESEASLGIGPAELAGLRLEDWVDLYTHPLVLAYLAETHAQTPSINSAQHLAEQTLAKVAGFDRFCWPVGDSKIKLLAEEPDTPVVLKALRMKGKGSRKDHCLDATLLGEVDPVFSGYQAQLVEALRLIKAELPGYYRDIEQSVQYIVLTRDASFRGSSSLYHLGMIYFCPDDSWTTLKWAEELVHESSHQILEYLAYENKMFTGEEAVSALTFDAPLRADKRPAYGIIHALFVVARINSMYGALGLSEPEKAAAAVYLDDIVSRARETMHVLRGVDFLSDFGRKLIDEFIAPNLQNSALAEPRVA